VWLGRVGGITAIPMLALMRALTDPSTKWLLELRADSLSHHRGVICVGVHQNHGKLVATEADEKVDRRSDR